MNATAKHSYVWLDLVRGLSAIVVCANHLRATMFVDYSALATSTLAQKAFYLATGLGTQAVMVFFVLSGFFVGGSVLRSGQQFRPENYAVARLSRLWVVLVPALFLTAVFDLLIGQVAPEVLTGAYRPVWNSGPVSAADYSSSWVTFAANLLFLQTIVTPVFGTNGPLWSLAYEFWYYVLFPLITMAFGWSIPARRGSWGRRLALGALALLILVWLPRGIVAAFPIWLLGLVVLALAGKLRGTASRRLLLAAGCLSFVGGVAYSKSAALQALLGLPADAVLGVGFCVLCVALANMPPPRRPDAAWVRLSQGLSAFSYSLYLVHFPIVMLIGAMFYRTRRLTVDFTSMVYFGLWMAVLLAAGAIFWWVFERRTDVLRHAMSRLTGRFARPNLSSN